MGRQEVLPGVHLPTGVLKDAVERDEPRVVVTSFGAVSELG